jgi:hypothetical protein
MSTTTNFILVKAWIKVAWYESMLSITQNKASFMYAPIFLTPTFYSICKCIGNMARHGMAKYFTNFSMNNNGELIQA